MTAPQNMDSPFPDDAPTDPVAYDKWFREKVQAARADTRPGIPHEEAMVQVRARMALKRDKKDA